MLRETDSAMTVVSSSAVSPRIQKSFAMGANVPSFHASKVDQAGISPNVDAVSEGTADSLVPQVASFVCGHACSGVLTEDAWTYLERGLRQRFDAVSACMDKIVSEGTIPRFLNESRYLSKVLPTALGPVNGTTRSEIAWAWLVSTDLYWTSTGELIVLDHNFSLPTGLERLSPGGIVSPLTDVLFSDWTKDGGRQTDREIAVLDPGFYSATFRGNEFLARCLKAHLVRCSDLTIRSDGVFLKVGSKTNRIDTIVRRIDDDLLDPNCFRPESLVGLPGLVRAWKNGLVNVLSPPGCDFANSRSFGRSIPVMIREFLREEPLLRSVEILECGDAEDFQKVVANADRYAIRTNDPRHPAQPFFGAHGRTAECSDLIRQIARNPSAYVARPLLPKDQPPGLHLRVFATMGKSFRLLRRAVGRAAQPDGGAPFSIGYDAETMTVS
jgi:uncharacterized circularly permuted ATP-grasp superfamily protein